MRKLFSLVIFALLVPVAHAQGCGQSKISIPLKPSDVIFTGSDGQLPKNSCHYFFSVGKISSRTPRTLVDAEDEIIDKMPHWMYRAVQFSSGDSECLVRVNKIDYFSILIEFFDEKWRVRGLSVSKFLKFNAGDDYLDVFQQKLCEKIKSNRGKLRTIGSGGSLKDSA